MEKFKRLVPETFKSHLTTTGQAMHHPKENGKYLDLYKNWSWEKNLEFLKPHLNFAVTMSNVREHRATNVTEEDTTCDVVEEEYIDVENSTEKELPADQSSSVIPEAISQVNSKRRIDREPAPVSNIDKVLDHLKKKQKVTPNSIDADEMLMLSHAKTLKTFSKRRQVIAKKRIAEIIGDLEIEQIDESENN